MRRTRITHTRKTPGRMSKECGKWRYPDKVSALLVLAKVQHNDSTTRFKIEQRAYFHNKCHGWHLTSRRA